MNEVEIMIAAIVGFILLATQRWFWVILFGLASLFSFLCMIVRLTDLEPWSSLGFLIVGLLLFSLAGTIKEA